MKKYVLLAVVRSPETVDDTDSMSSRSMSPDLGDMWRQGCPKSPEWEGEVELDSADEEKEGDNAGAADENEGGGLEDHLKQVIECPVWVLVCDFFSSADVLEMRTTGLKWNIARLYGSFTELWFFLAKKEENDKSEPLPEWPSLRYDYRQIYGFDNGILNLGRYWT